MIGLRFCGSFPAGSWLYRKIQQQRTLGMPGIILTAPRFTQALMPLVALRHIARKIIPIAFLLLSCNIVIAQSSNLSDVIGIPPDAAIYPIPGVGFVNLNNGNLHIEIPIRTVKDRNGKTITTNITYDNSVWQPIDVPGPNGGSITVWAAWPALARSSWQSNLSITETPNIWGRVSLQPTPYQCGNAQIQQWTNFQYVDEHGTIHNFPQDIYTEAAGPGVGCPDIKEIHVAATDASGYWLNVSNYTNATVLDMHGNVVTNGGVDTNGNFPNSSNGGFRDTLGRSLSLPGGFVYSYSRIHVWTNFNSPGMDEMNTTTQPDNLVLPVLSSLTLPDGRKYLFQYDDAGTNPGQPGHYGALTGITLPTGGQITIVNQPVALAGQNPGLGVQQITTPDGTWNFSYQGAITATAPPDPATGLASQTTLTGSVAPDGITYISTIRVYPGAASGSPLRTIATANPLRPTDIAVTNSAGQTSHVSYTYVDARCTSRVSSKKEYDFSGSLIRETDVNYFTSASDNTSLCQEWNSPPTWSSAYAQRHIIDIPQSITVYGAGGSSSPAIAQTNFTYDSTPLSTTSGSAGNSVLGLSNHDDANFGPSMSVRGNPTVISQMTASGNFITTRTNYYNILGDVVQTQDGKGNLTNYDYTDSWNDSSCISSAVFAYPTTVTNALNQAAKSKYNSCDGTTAAVQDPNDVNASRPGTVYSYDGRQRVTNIAYPDGGNKSIDYGGSQIPEVITTNIAASPSPTITSTQKLDGLGRTTQTVAPGGAIIDTTYDALGRVHSVSNPYFTSSDPTYGVTTYTYDTLGQKTIQTQQDGSKLQWCYNNVATNGQTNCLANKSNQTADAWVDFSDEAGGHWQRVFDSLGRLVAVMEPDGGTNVTAVPNQETDYQYDALGNLAQVNQHGLVRSSTYDSLSRLLTSSNPETGTVTYSYDANGNVQSRTDARGIQTAYSYDALNRLTSKTYSDGTPAAHFNYDETTVTVGSGFWHGPHQIINGRGRMTSWYVGSSAPGLAMRSFDYDAMGRINDGWRCFVSTCSLLYGTEEIWAQYDLAGNLTMMNAQARMNYTYDGAGRLQTAEYVFLFQQPNPTVPLVTSATYTASGQPATRNGNESWTYDKRLRVTSYTNKSSPTSSTVNAGYSLTYSPNGNVQSNTETSGSLNPVWNYTYDNLNRLSTAVTNPPFTEGCQESYDTFGNRTSQQPYGGSGYSCGSSSLSFTGNGTVNNNRIDGYCYDASGNLLDDGPCPASGGHKYTYDAEGRMATALYGNIVNTYGADGLRSSTGNSGQTPTYFYYDFDGRIIGHVSAYGNGGLYGPFEVWINGAHFGSIDVGNSNPVVPKLTLSITDWLGTERVRTDASNNLQAIFCNLPFGDFLTTCYGTDPYPADITHFTGKERDSESGLDYFGARHYSSTMGRFMSPDWDKEPSPVPYAYLQNPQSLNLYSYVLNNPLSNTDPDGHTHQECAPDESSTTTDASGNTTVTVTAGACHNVPDWWNIWTNFQNWRQNFATSWNQRIAANQKYALPDNQLDKDFYGTLVQAISFFSSLGGVDITNSGSRFPNKDTGMTQEEFGRKLESEGFSKGQASDGSVQYTRSGPNGKEEITMYPQRTSTGGPGGQVKENGLITGKLSFKP